ncbi:MAG: alkaline phosphatase family protein [Desulfobacterales bacterium]|jgi:hypothetical protein|nr:alkaline phosphatase family protein [Desulfobacterales bacterium]
MRAKTLLLIVPAALLVQLAAFCPLEAPVSVSATRHPAPAAGERGQRQVIVIVDSLRQATLEKPGVMPHLFALAMAEGTRSVPVLTCSANFSLPCLQTLMEGRQSPFASGLHNFTGKAGGAESFARSVQQAGLRLALVGDHTLLSLYGKHAEQTWTIESVAGDPLQRDLAAIRKAAELLDAEPAFDVLLLHVPGTDKAAHHKRPGTAAYDEHHRQVDEALAAVWRRIDPARDDLLIMGDHGHDDLGNHTRYSLALFNGPHVAELFGALKGLPEGLGQEDLLLFMSYPFGLPLPASYEGRFFPLEKDAAHSDGAGTGVSDSLRRFEEMQRRAWLAPNEEKPSLAAVQAQREERRRDAPKRLLNRMLPLIALAFSWALFFFDGRVGPARTALAATLFFVASSAAVCSFSASAGGWALAFIGWTACACLAWRYRAQRSFAFLCVATAGAGLMGCFARDWAELMHTRESVNYQAILFHLLLPLIGAAMAWVRFGSGARFPEGMGLVCLLVLPSGVYYYQSGRNLLLGYAIGEAMLLSWRGVRALYLKRKAPLRWRFSPWISPFSLRRPAAGIAFAFALTVLVFQAAGGWEWRLQWVSWLRSGPEWVPLFFFWAIGGYLTLQVPSIHGRYLLLAVLCLTRLYSVGIAGLDLSALTASLVAVLLLSAVLELDPAAPKVSDGRETSDASNPNRHARDALLIAGVLAWMLWVLMRGFFINHVDYHFAFDLLGGIRRESSLALAIAMATLLKYGLPLAFALLFFRLRRGRDAFRVVFPGLLFLLQLKLFFLLIQALLIPLRTDEKLHELALAEIVFFLGILIIALIVWLLLGGLDRGGPRHDPDTLEDGHQPVGKRMATA